MWRWKVNLLRIMLFVDWVSPPIYDVYPGEEDLLNEVSFVVDTLKFIEESPHNEGF
jgi:hypothetical protein